MKKLKKWAQIYPQGTKEGNEEQLLFIGKDRCKGLARHPSYTWRSTASLVQESGLPQDRVEEILNKYFKLGLVFMCPTKEDHWGYWERVPQMVKDDPQNIDTKDKTARIDDHLKNHG